MVEAILGWLKLLQSDVFSFSCRLRFYFFDSGVGGKADIFPET